VARIVSLFLFLHPAAHIARSRQTRRSVFHFSASLASASTRKHLSHEPVHPFHAHEITVAATYLVPYPVHYIKPLGNCSRSKKTHLYRPELALVSHHLTMPIIPFTIWSGARCCFFGRASFRQTVQLLDLSCSSIHPATHTCIGSHCASFLPFLCLIVYCRSFSSLAIEMSILSFA
jgi:hypothetical protein